MHWKWKTFEKLTNQELYDILALRQEVFILEQKCLYPDIDYQDQKAIHLVGIKNHKVAAYLRLFPKGKFYPEAISFGRVLIEKSLRGRGYAKEAMQQVMDYLKEHPDPVTISAQVYLQPFYETYGFQKVGIPYDEDGIPHLEMHKNLSH